MCGIVGYIGEREAAPVLLEGLKRLEYRGYDSSGTALLNKETKELCVHKKQGKIAVLEEALAQVCSSSDTGIAHTRWATHGVPSDENAHPHVSADGTIAVVHNGIIENQAVWREVLQREGYAFKSETDSEVLAHLIQRYWAGDLESSVRLALRHVKGTYGVGVISSHDPEKIVTARMGSPLVIGLGENENFFASDPAALVAYTRQVIYLNDGEMAVITRHGCDVSDLNALPIPKEASEIHWEIQEIERAGYPHFMLKEIFEQPRALQDAIRGRLIPEEGISRLCGLNLNLERLRQIDRLIITACGTSWHAGLVGEYLIEEIARVPVEVEYASEFRYRNPIIREGTVLLAVSQSGETADTLAALREAKGRGAAVLGVCNAVGSTIARETEGGVYIHAGPEIGVASTKAFTCQAAVLSLIALLLGRMRDYSVEQGKGLAEALLEIPQKVQSILENSGPVFSIAEELKASQNALYLGRGINFPVALEGALKLKEVSYIHAEGYPAAEMKHGPIALIDKNMPVIVIALRDGGYDKMISNIREVKARQGYVIAVATEGDEEITQMADRVIHIPSTHPLLTPLLSVIPLQLLAYHVAVARGCDVDQPRNLAKSVTVE